MKGKRDLVWGDELEMEEEGVEDAAIALSEDGVEEPEIVIEIADVAVPYPDRNDDEDDDMLSDLSLEGAETDWEYVTVP